MVPARKVHLALRQRNPWPTWNFWLPMVFMDEIFVETY